MTTATKPPQTASGDGLSAVQSRSLGRRRPSAMWLLLGLYAIPPFVLSDYDLFRFTGVTLYVLIAVGYNVITGYGGQFVVISAAMLGVGAYATAQLLEWNVPLALAILLTACFSSVVGYLMAALTARLRGIYLALMSVGLASAATIIMLNWTAVTGGEIGKRVVNLSIRGDAPPTYTEVYIVVTGVTVIGLLVSWRLLSGQWGRVLKAQARNELAACSAGINVEGTKRAALAVSCFYFGLAGGLYALTYGYLSPNSFGLQVAVLHLAMIVVGGLGTFIGPVLGAYVIGGIPVLLNFSPAYQTLLFACAIFFVVYLVPEGLAAGPKRLFQSFRRNATFFFSFGRRRYAE